MKTLLLSLMSFGCALSQNATTSTTANDTLIYIEKSPADGFHHDYLLFVPKQTTKQKPTYLLVEVNNSGRVSDSIEVHKKLAIELASVRSLGNNISTELHIPLLVPIFPRPASDSLMYTHALDRDAILAPALNMKRLDLQLIAMIAHSRKKLESFGINVHEKVFMNGFSASGSFTNRFVMLHPNVIKAAAMGGLNGELMLPLKDYMGNRFNYPLGIGDFRKIFKKDFDARAYKSVPQFIYMGALDDNDAVQYDDAYSAKERRLINSLLGDKVQPRWRKVQSIYLAENVNARFKTYEEVGHWTTSKVNLEVIMFFLEFMKPGKS